MGYAKRRDPFLVGKIDKMGYAKRRDPFLVGKVDKMGYAKRRDPFLVGKIDKMGYKMTTGFIVTLLRSSIVQTLSLAAPVLLSSMLIGLIISIFQAVTSIQDQTLTFVPKIVAILTIIGIFGAWMISSMASFTVNIFELIPEIAG